MNRVYRLRRPYRTEWSFVGVRWVIEWFDMERGRWIIAMIYSMRSADVHAYWWAFIAGGDREPMYACEGD